MQAALSLLGPKTTAAIVLVVLVIAPIAVWHHAHVIARVVRALWRDDRL
jgi:hypothetical protein